MSVSVVIACFVTGLVIGSFLNVVIWRVPRGESIVNPPSHCPRCGHRIRARDNLPIISWVLLRGRCRDCANPISARYPGVEVLTGAMFAVMGWRFGAAWELPAYLYVAAIGVALSLIDLDTLRLPDAITLPSYPVLAVLLLLPATIDGAWPAYLRAGLGGIALFSLYLVLVLVHPAGMGFGDVKLAGLLGIALAWVSWGALVVGAFLGYLLAGLVGVALLVVVRAGRGTAIPFGPFMIAGAVLGLFVGEPVSAWYATMLTG